jgi:hypothetical protein
MHQGGHARGSRCSRALAVGIAWATLCGQCDGVCGDRRDRCVPDSGLASCESGRGRGPVTVMEDVVARPRGGPVAFGGEPGPEQQSDVEGSRAQPARSHKAVNSGYLGLLIQAWVCLWSLRRPRPLLIPPAPHTATRCPAFSLVDFQLHQPGQDRLIPSPIRIGSLRVGGVVI